MNLLSQDLNPIMCAVIAFTESNHGKTIRIIALRKALTHERKAFEKAIKDRLG